MYATNKCFVVTNVQKFVKSKNNVQAMCLKDVAKNVMQRRLVAITAKSFAIQISNALNNPAKYKLELFAVAEIVIHSLNAGLLMNLLRKRLNVIRNAKTLKDLEPFTNLIHSWILKKLTILIFYLNILITIYNHCKKWRKK